ncbi:MAG TPA: type II secretion system protein GspL [Burkholderiales bacterium]
MTTRLKDRLAKLGTLASAPAALPGRGLQLRLPRGWPEVDPAVHWSGPPEVGAGRSENLAQLPPAFRGASVHVWTPAADTLLTRAKLPTRARARIAQALPFALEDQLLDEPEALHFAYVREADGSLAVAVTQRARLELWLEILRSAGLRPSSMSPSVLALPLHPGAWSVAFVDDEIWVRSGPHAGFVALASGDEPPPLLAAALRDAANQGARPERLVVYSPPAAFAAEPWSRALELPVTSEPTPPGPPRLPALNLLQAEYGHGAQVRQLLRPLRPAFALLALWLIVGVGFDVYEWIRLRQAHAGNLAQMHAVYRQAFGSPAQYPYEQMVRSIEMLQTRGGGAGDLLPLLARVAPTLQARQADVKLRSLKYADRSLTLDLTLPDYQALDAVKNTLQGAGLDVAVVAANARGSEVDGRLRVQARAAAQVAARPRS